MERTGRTSICSIVFTDITAYSKLPDARQMSAKARLNDVIAKAIERVAESERLVLDTGDGAVICFFGDPEDAILGANVINTAFRDGPDAMGLTLRTGINLGPVKVITDINGRPNVIGDGINVAQRVMSFADEGEILVSRSYYEVVSRLREGNENLFHYLGIKKDKHVREHQVYTFGLQSSETRRDPVAVETESSAPTRAGLEGGSGAPAPSGLVSPETLEMIERRLTKRVGPLGQVIIARAAATAGNVHEFYRTISSVIPDEADRASFLAGLPVGSASSAPRTADRPAPREAQAAASGALTQQELRLAERRLAEQIGPLASVLVKKAAQEATGVRDLYHRLSENLPDRAHKDAFLGLLDTDA